MAKKYLIIENVFTGLTNKSLLLKEFEDCEIMQKQDGAYSFYRSSINYELIKM